MSDLIDTADIAAILGVGTSTILNYVKANPAFPKPIQGGPGRGSYRWNGVEALTSMGFSEEWAARVIATTRRSSTTRLSTVRRPKEPTLHRILAARLQGAQRRGRRKGRECTVTMATLKEMHAAQGGRCAVSGVPFDISEGSSGPFAPSLDRIDSTKGYEAGNVRLVCHAINLMMNMWGDKVYHAFVQKLKEVPT